MVRGLRKMVRGCFACKSGMFLIVSVGGENEPLKGLKCDGGEEELRSSVASSSSSKKSAHAITWECGLNQRQGG